MYRVLLALAVANKAYGFVPRDQPVPVRDVETAADPVPDDVGAQAEVGGDEDGSAAGEGDDGPAGKADADASGASVGVDKVESAADDDGGGASDGASSVTASATVASDSDSRQPSSMLNSAKLAALSFRDAKRPATLRSPRPTSVSSGGRSPSLSQPRHARSASGKVRGRVVAAYCSVDLGQSRLTRLGGLGVCAMVFVSVLQSIGEGDEEAGLPARVAAVWGVFDVADTRLSWQHAAGLGSGCRVAEGVMCHGDGEFEREFVAALANCPDQVQESAGITQRDHVPPSGAIVFRATFGMMV